MKRFVCIIALVGAASLTRAEVEVFRGGESDQPAGEHSVVIIRTRDRQSVPALETTKATKTGPETGTAETITHLRDAQGNYFQWQRASSTAQELAPGKIERTTEVVEYDRQGGARERRLVKQIAEKVDGSERISTLEYRPNSSGEMALSHEVSARATKSSDGTATESRTESDYDVNGRAVVTRQVDAISKTDGNIVTTTTTAKSKNHLDGNIGVEYREIATVSTAGDTIRTESIRQRPAGAGWDNDGRMTSIQKRATDGTIQRETIVEGRSLYARQGGRTEFGELVPRTRTVDREIRQPDGTTVIHREVFRRDVNGDWALTTFSTEGASRAAW